MLRDSLFFAMINRFPFLLLKQLQGDVGAGLSIGERMVVIAEVKAAIRGDGVEFVIG